MYKTVLKSLNKSEKSHSITNKKPHYIFSAQKPRHEVTSSMNHGDVVDFLNEKGYKTEVISGKYGGEKEDSIIVHNVKQDQIEHLDSLASSLGQDSSIVSNGYDHEMHYLHGKNKGLHHKGQGTVLHTKEPEDYYSTLSNGTHFTHAFDFDNLHSESSLKPQKQEKIEKSEENKASTMLIHYSPQKGLKTISAKFQGSRVKDESSKQGIPNHPTSFFYREGVEPESTVTSGTQSKYIVDASEHKLYDIAHDPEGIRSKAKEQAQKIADSRQVNPGIVSSEDMRNIFNQHMKDSGYHGFYNSSLDNTMKNVVALFDDVSPSQEIDLHPNDFKITSIENHHEKLEKGEMLNAAKAATVLLGLAYGAQDMVSNKSTQPNRDISNVPEHAKVMSQKEHNHDIVQQARENARKEGENIYNKNVQKEFTNKKENQLDHTQYRDIIQSNKELNAKYGHLNKLSDNSFKEIVQVHDQLRNDINNHHYSQKLKQNQGNHEQTQANFTHRRNRNRK